MEVNLHEKNMSLHEKNHFLTLKVAELTEQLNAKMTRADDLENKYEDVEYDLSKTRMRSYNREGLKLRISKTCMLPNMMASQVIKNT